MFKTRNRKNKDNYVEWVRTYDIKIWLPKRVNGRWRLEPKKFHYEQEFKAPPKKSGNVLHKKWQSKKGKGYFELKLGRRKND